MIQLCTVFHGNTEKRQAIQHGGWEMQVEKVGVTFESFLKKTMLKLNFKRCVGVKKEKKHSRQRNQPEHRENNHSTMSDSAFTCCFLTIPFLSLLLLLFYKERIYWSENSSVQFFLQ